MGANAEQQGNWEQDDLAEVSYYEVSYSCDTPKGQAEGTFASPTADGVPARVAELEGPGVRALEFTCAERACEVPLDDLLSLASESQGRPGLVEAAYFDVSYKCTVAGEPFDGEFKSATTKDMDERVRELAGPALESLSFACVQRSCEAPLQAVLSLAQGPTATGVTVEDV